ncbi:MAG: DUF4105 domain-containing protein [Myxococcales bacterium]|nr:DUF4105 domain-containing protein [Myxococcales bacterium]
MVCGTARAQAPWGTAESNPEDLAIWLVTFGPGDDVASWFGHSALVVVDQRLKRGRLYNYGMFSFDPTMLTRFAMGRLTFWVGDAPVEGTLSFYQAQDRDVRIQELNLSPGKRMEIARFLANNVLPENRDYLYHHYNDNCATRPRDAIDRVLGGELKKAYSGPGRMTLRDHTRRHSAVLPPMSVLLDFLMNHEIDRPIAVWDEAFLPAELERQVGGLRFADESGQPVSFVMRAWTPYRSSRPPVPDRPPPYGPWMLLLGLCLGAVPLALAARHGLSTRRRRVLAGLHQVLVGLMLGLPGLALAIMWAFTEHTVTWRNENLLLANPLTFLALPLGIALCAGARWASWALDRVWLALAATGILALALKVLPWFDQDNWRLIALILPANLGAALAFFVDRRARRRAATDAIIELPARRRGRPEGRTAEGSHGS